MNSDDALVLAIWAVFAIAWGVLGYLYMKEQD